MHDTAIVNGIVEAVLGKVKGKKVKAVSLRVAVGALKHVHEENLVFWLREMLKKELGEKVEVNAKVETVQPEIKCECGFQGKVQDFHVSHDMAHAGLFEMRCPKCNSKGYEILKGNSAEITDLQVELE